MDGHPIQTPILLCPLHLGHSLVCREKQEDAGRGGWQRQTPRGWDTRTHRGKAGRLSPSLDTAGGSCVFWNENPERPRCENLENGLFL